MYYDTEEIKPNNEVQEIDLEKRKVVINTVSKSYNKLLNIYTTQYNKLLVDLKKRIDVINKPEMLILDFDEDDEAVKLKLKETTAERIKLNPRKRKTTETGLKIFQKNY